MCYVADKDLEGGRTQDARNSLRILPRHCDSLVRFTQSLGSPSRQLTRWWMPQPSGPSAVVAIDREAWTYIIINNYQTLARWRNLLNSPPGSLYWPGATTSNVATCTPRVRASICERSFGCIARRWLFTALGRSSLRLLQCRKASK